MRRPLRLRLSCLSALSLALCGPCATLAPGAGTLVARGSPDQLIAIREHHVDVVLNNGFARTEVVQTFFNPNPIDVEALYSFPLPKSASLSEVTIFAGEQELHGEVVAKDAARAAYGEEQRAGNDAGLATKNGFQTFEFAVAAVRAGQEARIRFVYYQPLEIDTGAGRYVYPLQDGGTDDAAQSFWSANERVEQSFTFDLELKSAWPVDRVRVAGFEQDTVVDTLGPGHFKVHVAQQAFALDRDLVFYYLLQDDLPGRVELVAHKRDAAAPGTFLLVLTPGIDLAPLAAGADFTFVLDVSGSMQTKLATLGKGVAEALGQLRAGDRFRIVTFNNQARELTRGYVAASPETIREAVSALAALASSGGTNLYEGIALALRGLDGDRATSLVLVTDGVANLGITDGPSFHQLMKRCDVRVFGFLLGNSANWPLLRTICDASGGFAASVSNQDDIVGQLLLAKSKIAYECLHDCELTIRGIATEDVGAELLGKVYRGQQLAIFGRYPSGGRAEVTLKATITGEEKVYRAAFDFPEVAAENPELERLFGLAAIERIEAQQNAGLLEPAEGSVAIRDLGVRYQLVTDETSMLVLSDDAFQRRGIARDNRARVAEERAAQAVRATEPPRSRRVDEQAPMFDQPAPKRSGGGGAFGPLEAALAGLLALGALLFGRRRAG